MTGQVFVQSRMAEEILEFGRRISGSGWVKAAFSFDGSSSNVFEAKHPLEVVFVVHGFRPKLMNYVRVFSGRSVLMIGVDAWVFERDVDKGFLGEAVVWGLIFPYVPLMNQEYLHEQETKLKKRLIMEMLENLVLDFPQLSHELLIEPEYFLYEAMLSRVRLFPPMIDSLADFVHAEAGGEMVDRVLKGYADALEELQHDGVIHAANGRVGISDAFISKAQNPTIRLVNMSKTIPRRLFTTFLRLLPRTLKILSESREGLVNLSLVTKKSRLAAQIETPSKHIYIPTASGLVSLANKTSIGDFVRKSLSAGEKAEIVTRPLGGIFNDVYLVEVLEDAERGKFVVKQFKDWSSFKWFPLSLWSIGTKTFAVLGRTRLERECSINRFLESKGFDVPRLLHVSPEERLVFMEFIDGQSTTETVRNIASTTKKAQMKKALVLIERIGRKLAKVHAVGVALGDTKPENIIIGKHSEIYFVDLEQASRNGDKAWDVAEFLYYAGHDVFPLAQASVVESIARAFIKGYLAGGGDVEVVKKAAKPKYTKVFSVFTAPHLMLAISSICRKAEELEGD